MSTKGVHILFHRPTPWDSELNCSTKIYARLFEKKGYSATYLQASINFGHLLLRRGYYRHWRIGSRFDGGIWVTGALTLLPYFDRFRLLAPALTRWSYKTAAPSIRSLVERSGYGEPDVIWTTIPGSGILKNLFPRAKLIFHVIDSYSAYRGSQIRSIESRDYRDADHVFVIGEALKHDLLTRFRVDERKVTCLGQGVDLDAYRRIDAEPDVVAGTPKPRAVWVGLTRKLDERLLKAAADRIAQEGGTVFIVGQPTNWLEDFARKNSHCRLLGASHYSRVPQILGACDIGLMLYDRSRPQIYQGQNPLKLYEYAAAGLAVISTPHDEFRFLSPPVDIVTNEIEVASALSHILHDLGELQDRMREFAAAYSWEKCVEKAESVVANLTAAR